MEKLVCTKLMDCFLVYVETVMVLLMIVPEYYVPQMCSTITRLFVQNLLWGVHAFRAQPERYAFDFDFLSKKSWLVASWP